MINLLIINHSKIVN